MSATTSGLIIFVCVSASAPAGMILRAILPDRYFSNDAKDLLRLGVTLMTTMNALILGLLISTAKSSYDARRAQLTQMAADAILIDRSLAMYGAETSEIRRVLRELVANLIDQIQSLSDGRHPPPSAASEARAIDFYRLVRGLSPRDDEQKALKAEAVRASFAAAQIRALAMAQESSSIPTPFLVVMVFWLVVLFVGYGLFAPPNPMVFIATGVLALAVSAALVMILSMDEPFHGIIQISVEPLRNALTVLGK